MSFYLVLQKAHEIVRDEDGVPTSWVGGSNIETFTDPDKAIKYIQNNASKLKDAVFFTGSASLLVNANTYLATILKERKLI